VKGRGIAVLVVVALFAVAALVAGCGSDSSTSAAATEESSAPLTKADFVKQATQICHQGVKEKEKAVSDLLEKTASQKGGASSQDVKGLMEDSVLPTYSDVVDQLGQLSPPKGDQAKLDKILQKYEAALKSVEADPAKAAEGENPFAAADEGAIAYGLEACRL
jgi:hypothetical protein